MNGSAQVVAALWAVAYGSFALIGALQHDFGATFAGGAMFGVWLTLWHQDFRPIHTWLEAGPK